METDAREGDSPVGETVSAPGAFPSTTGHEKPCGKLGGPSSKAKYEPVTDSEQVPRGKGEKHPGRGVKETLKPYVYKLWKGDGLVPARPRAFCLMNRRVIFGGARLRRSAPEP